MGVRNHSRRIGLLKLSRMAQILLSSIGTQVMRTSRDTMAPQCTHLLSVKEGK